MAASPFPLTGRVGVPSPATGAVPGGYAICRVCRGPARPGCDVCWSCLTVARRLGRPLWPVVPLFLLEASSGAHAALVAYKAARSGQVREAAASALTELLSDWLREHAPCLEHGCLRPEAGRLGVVPVPSSSGGRASWGALHPLSICGGRAVERSGVRNLELLVALEPADRPPGRLCPRGEGYLATREVSGRDVIVLEDLFVSGARSMSAAAAMVGAGAHVKAVVTLGRIVRPAHSAATASYWAELGNLPPGSGSCLKSCLSRAPMGTAA